MHTETFSSLTLSVGNIDVKKFIIEDAKCDLEVAMTYGCTSCTRLPYVLIRANNIKSTGALEYTSNCTFDRPLLSCSSIPYYLITRMIDNITKFHVIVSENSPSIEIGEGSSPTKLILPLAIKRELLENIKISPCSENNDPFEFDEGLDFIDNSEDSMSSTRKNKRFKIKPIIVPETPESDKENSGLIDSENGGKVILL